MKAESTETLMQTSTWTLSRKIFNVAMAGLVIACSSGDGVNQDPRGAGGEGHSTNGTGGGPGGGDPGSGGSIEGSGGGVMGSSGGSPSSGGSTLGSQEEYPFPADAPDEDGYKLWLRYPKVPIPLRLAEYQALFLRVVNSDNQSATLNAAAEELTLGLSGLLGNDVAIAASAGVGDVLIGKAGNSVIDALALEGLAELGPEGYLVQQLDAAGGKMTVVAGNSDIGVLYGSFALLRHLQTHSAVDTLLLRGAPKIKNRILNHWDNLDGSVERGYAGQSIWDWDALPGDVSARITDYARANASLGINGTVLTNVNATKNNNEDMWTQRAQYFPKVKALADVLRPYGIRVYLTAPFNAGGTANPNDAATRQWWVDRMNELYEQIPDFGGLLIKASSEGEPGPSNGATHADGANMLATAVGDRGLVLWRAFVYGSDLSSDRIAQGYQQFNPLDGDFDDNVFVQVKNGPLDFQPREPFHQLFGGMPQTKLALEFQITKEYLGQDTHLAYVGTMYEELLQTDTKAQGAGSTVARVIDGSLDGHDNSAIAGVSNIGSDTNWTGSHFNQANWYAYGRMAWDPDASAEALAEEWVRQTLSNDPALVEPVVQMLMMSHEALVNYMTPLGLAHIMGTDHHYGPAPWVNDLSTPEWNPFYYHKADSQGIGFDRTSAGSGAIDQYSEQVAQLYGDRQTVPEQFLLFFHRVAWSDALSSGRTLWQELVHRYSLGVDEVATMRENWEAAEGRIDAERYGEMNDFLQIQHYEARWWRDACLSYFASVGNQIMPSGYAPTAHDLSFYQGLTCPSNVTKPRCSPIETGEPSPAIVDQ